MEPTILIILVVMTAAYGGRVDQLRKKVIGLEMSLYQDISMLRDDIGIVNNKLDMLLEIQNGTQRDNIVYKEIDDTVIHVRDKSSSTSYVENVLTKHMKRMRRALTDLKADVKLQQKNNELELTETLTHVINKLEGTVREINENVSSLLPRTEHTITSMTETAINKQESFIENVTNRLKTEYHALRNSTLDIEFTNVKILKVVEMLEINFFKMLLLEDVSLKPKLLRLIDNRLKTVSSEMMCESQINEMDTCFALKSLPDIKKVLAHSNIIRLGNISVLSDTIGGRLEVMHDGKWGTVCDDLFLDTSALVACRMLGYSNGVAEHEAYFGPGSGNIWLEYVMCEGDEENILSCPRRNNINIGVHDCAHTEDVGVICTVV